MTAPGQAGRRGDGWIRVIDGLPACDQEVLAFSKSDQRVHCSLFFQDDTDLVGYFYDNNPDDPTAGVTHWMPLPSPPLADGQEGEDGGN